MIEFLIAVLALGLGLVAGILWDRRRAAKHGEQLAGELSEARTELRVLETRWSDREAAHEKELAAITSARKELEDAFGNLSKGALKENSQAFLTLAEEKLKPIQQKIRELEEERKALEAKRDRDHGSLKEHLEKLTSAQESLGRHAHALSTALRGSSQARGRWGELALRKLVELAGMTEHVDFEEQETVAEGSRPDLVILLPGGDGIPVDAKVPLAAYLEAQEAPTPEQRRVHLDRHADQVRGHALTLARREYGYKTQGRNSFTVMFLAGDHFLEPAFRKHPGLQVEAMEKGVLITTPVTFLALLKTLGVYWREEAMAENAREIWDAARQLYERVATFAEHLGRTGSSLESAVAHFNKAVGSFERQVLPSGRRLQGLKVGEDARKELPALKEIDAAPRALRASEAGASE